MLPSSRTRSVVFLLLAASVGFAQQEFAGKVVAITDGDTLQVMHDGRAEKIRLNGIDAPEKKQPFSARATRLAGDVAFGKTVTVRMIGKDRYGRTIGDVVLPDGRLLNHELVKAGLAWWYRQYAPHDDELERLEAEARAARIGLWSERNPMTPWEFRAAGRR